jgi:hypothetical protein
MNIKNIQLNITEACKENFIALIIQIINEVLNVF